MRICIVAPGFPLLDPSSEPGISIELFALNLRRIADRIDVLAVYQPQNNTLFTWARQRYAAIGIELHCLFEKRFADNAASYAVYQWLRNRRFDHVVFPDNQGLGYFSFAAKWQGLDHAECALSSLAIMPSDLTWSERGEFRAGPEYLQRVFMERFSVEHSEHLFAVAPDLIEHYRSVLGRLPPAEVVPPFPMLPAAAGSSAGPSGLDGVTGPRTICFAGAIDSLNGVELFCAAIRCYCKGAEADRPVVALLGRNGTTLNGQSGAVYALNALRRIQFPILVSPTETLQEDLAFLQLRNAVLVACSPAAARSALVQGAARAGIVCIISTDSPVALSSGLRVLACARNPNALAQAIDEAFVRSWPDTETALIHDETWMDLFRSDLSSGRQKSEGSIYVATRAAGETLPMVSVCMSYFNRPRLLAQAIESLRRQTYPNVEVVLVDDASPSIESQTYIRSLAPEFASRSWRIIRNERELWQSASRNLAVRAARGDYILVMDDDNVAHPEEIESLLNVAVQTQSDVVWCFQNLFDGEDYPDLSEHKARVEFYPVGPIPAIGTVWNTSGDVNALFRKSVFDQIGGFSERVGIGCEDFEIGIKVALGGFRWAMVPRPLYGYRFSSEQMAKRLSNEALYWSHRRVVLPYADALPLDLADVPRLSNEAFHAEWQRHGVAYWRQFVGAPGTFKQISRDTQPLDAEFLFQLAGNCYENGSFDSALAFARDLHARFPQDERIAQLVLDVLTAQGKEDELEELSGRDDMIQKLMQAR